MIVVDANVSLKWFIPERGMAEALRVLRSGRKLIARAIIKEEVISGLVRRVRREELSAGEARESTSDWLRELRNETVHLMEDELLLVEAAEIGFNIKHPLFDCLYLALAMRLNVPLVTADRTLFERASAMSSNVYWLMDIETMLAA